MSTACLVGLACFVAGLEDPWLFSADQGLGPSNRPAGGWPWLASLAIAGAAELVAIAGVAGGLLYWLQHWAATKKVGLQF